MIREFGHSKEGNAKPAANYEDEKKELFIANEKNITLYANYRAISVKTDGNRIESVIIKHIENGKEVELKAPLFSDCTGDGTIGYLAVQTTTWDANPVPNTEKSWHRFNRTK